MFLSTTSTATFNYSLNHLPLGFIASTLLVFADICITFDILKKGILFVRFLLVQHPILFPTSDIKHHDALDFPKLNLQKLGGMCLSPLMVLLYLSYVQTKKTKSVLVQGICVIHIHVSRH